MSTYIETKKDQSTSKLTMPHIFVAMAIAGYFSIVVTVKENPALQNVLMITMLTLAIVGVAVFLMTWSNRKKEVQIKPVTTDTLTMPVIEIVAMESDADIDDVFPDFDIDADEVEGERVLAGSQS